MDSVLSGLPGLSQQDEFERWLALPGEWVEAPNARRGGLSGVQRLRAPDGRLLYRKQQVDHCYRDWLHPFGEPTVLREQRALRAFAALGVPVPEAVFCATRRCAGRRQALLVTAALEGYESLEACYARGDQQGWSDELRIRLFRRLGSLLARLHRARWQHGCLYPKHIFVRTDAAGQVEVALLDLEKSRRRLSRQRAARHDLRQLRRHSSWGSLEWESLDYGYRCSSATT
ncbi:lipopolysaccharide kinase InaA family protein [Pseudomonas stutzeri]|nr:lipopolysaccharide kinase InaA family protein [Stutzerimonas stutzeri]